jgi:predicted esterase
MASACQAQNIKANTTTKPRNKRLANGGERRAVGRRAWTVERGVGMEFLKLESFVREWQLNSGLNSGRIYGVAAL